MITVQYFCIQRPAEIHARARRPGNAKLDEMQTHAGVLRCEGSRPASQSAGPTCRAECVDSPSRKRFQTLCNHNGTRSLPSPGLRSGPLSLRPAGTAAGSNVLVVPCSEAKLKPDEKHCEKRQDAGAELSRAELATQRSAAQRRAGQGRAGQGRASCNPIQFNSVLAEHGM